MTLLRRFALPLAILGLCVGFYWKLALTDQYVWFDHPDMVYIEIPRLQFQAEELHRGQFPLWDSRIWAGQPLVGQTQPGPLYPFTLLFSALPLDGRFIRLAFLNWYYVFIHFQAALFMYWLARDLGRSRWAGVIAGCLFSFGGFIGTVAWLDVVNGAVWTPLVFLFLLRALRGQQAVASAALAGFFLGIAWLCGHHEIPMMVSYAAVFTLLFHVFFRGGFPLGRPNWTVARWALVFLLVMFLTSAVQTIPTYEFGRVSQRWVGLDHSIGWKETIPYVAHTLYSMSVRGIPGLAIYGVNQADSSPFMGIIAVGLAALGVLAGWKQHAVRWAAAVAAGALLYALGASTPLHGVFYSLLPMLAKARVPIRAIHLVHFGIAVLAAYGADFAADRESAWVRRIGMTLAGFGGVTSAVAVLLAASGHPPLDEKVLLSALVSLGAAGFLFAYRSGNVSSAGMLGGVLVLALVELTAVQNYPNRVDQNRNKFVNQLYENRDIGDFLRGQPEPVRAAVNDTDVPLNFGDWQGIDMLQGYVAGVSENVLRHELHKPKTQRLFAVNYYVAREAPRPGLEEVFAGRSGVKVFRNPEALPRAWAVHETVRVESDGELRVMINNPAFDPGRQAAMLGTASPALEQCGSAGQVRVVRHHSNRVTLQADMPCRGMIILADTDFAGWGAQVDGKASTLYETYGALRGVVVEAGRHGIEIRYRPWSVYGGGVLTVLGFGIAVAAWLRVRSRRGAAAVGAG